MASEISTGTRRTLSASALLVAFATVVGLLGIGGGLVLLASAAMSTSGSGASVPVVAANSQTMSETVSAVVHGAGLPGKAPVSLTREGPLMLSVYEDVSPLTRALAKADAASALISAGVAILLVVPVLRSTASRQPFAHGNARGLALAALSALIGWVLAATLPVVAAGEVLRSAALEPGVWEPVVRPDYWPLGFAALLGALALVTWKGHRVAVEAEGLV